MGSRRWIGLVGLLLLALAAAGCGRTSYTPEIAGVVVVEDDLPDGTTHYQLQNGQELTIDVRSLDRVIYGTVEPHRGDLLLSGTGPNGPWIARLHRATRTDLPTDCYVVESYGTDRGEWIETDAGLRLHKAPGFTAIDRRGDRYAVAGHVFCVGPDGQVRSFR